MSRRRKARAIENLGGGDVEFTDAELSELTQALEKHEVKGDRYFGDKEGQWLWQ